jgi:hypothetical protein
VTGSRFPTYSYSINFPSASASISSSTLDMLSI